MHINIQKDIFLSGLFKIQGIVDKKHTIPILSNVYLEAKDNKIILSATDLEIGIKAEYTCEVLENGKITISAKKLFEIIKEFPNDIIKLKLKENYWLEISCCKSIFNLVGLPPEDFPKFPEIKDNFIEFKSSLLEDMIESTIFSVSSDETKYNLTGIYIKKEKDNKLNFVSTDGHRLSLIKTEAENIVNEQFERGFILPKKGLIELKKIIESETEIIKIGVTDNIFSYMNKNMTFVMRMIDGEFPDFKRVIPEKTDNFSVIDSKKFINVLKRISVLSSEKSKGVKIGINKNKLIVSSSNPDFGDAKEEMDIDYQGSDIVIGFNAKYILDILNVIKTDKIYFYIKDNISPGMITPYEDTNFLSVIMPMRL